MSDNGRTATSSNYVPTQPDSLVLPSAAISEQAADLLEDLFIPPHETSQHTAVDDPTLDSVSGNQNEERTGTLTSPSNSRPPWWKRPSPWWLLTVVPFTSIAMGATIAPRIELYTILACSTHKPDIFNDTYRDSGSHLTGWSTLHITPENSILKVPIMWVNTPDTRSAEKPSDPKKPNLCASDPVVQAEVAKLAAFMTASMGTLSCITGAWWGAYSDRHGRLRVMGISVFGLLLTDFNFIFTYSFYQRLPGGYWFLLLGPLVEGVLGGMTGAVAAIHAYMSDTTHESERSRTLSLALGLLFTGIAIGPTFGAILIRATGETISIFYVTLILHFIYAMLVWFVIPESLSKSSMKQSRIKYRQEIADLARERQVNPAVGWLIKLKRIFAFLTPLTVFMPVSKTSANPLKRPRRDWTLTLLAIAYGISMTTLGSYTYKFQYAAATFGWSSETLGYWLSLVGAARAFYLTILLPLVIKLLQLGWAPPTRDATRTEESESLLSPRPPSAATESTVRPSTAYASEPTSSAQPVGTPASHEHHRNHHSLVFDLGLTRISVLIEVVGALFMGLAPTALWFTISGIVGSFGAGFSPAIQSVALAIYTRQGGSESGRLFGALSVLQALGSQIIGPFAYGLVYVNTVATYPRAVFFVTVAAMSFSFILTTFVGLDALAKPTNTHVEEASGDTAVDSFTDEGDETGTHQLEETLIVLNEGEVHSESMSSQLKVTTTTSATGYSVSP
ncbi:MFS general substrate transporter [Pluteus cervinus]|uniref:MFS general substrate transporter n=1 Tax=Pluteus cervinus TaxID=181527 RepID=A0ACD3B457_9AGAR|nr:MFS general substrate transporter [Pluteus cervinus]